MNRKALALLVSLAVLASLVFGMVVFASHEAHPAPDRPRDRLPSFPAPTDHRGFFPGEYADGPAVTRRCLECHPSAATEVMATTHWTWSGAHAVRPDTGETVSLGKRNVINNFCISVAANWPRCTSCHAGYGWRDDGFLAEAGPSQVDCLVCHDQTGLYQKDPAGAGDPAKGTDLAAAARSVGRTSRANCGACHFKGGGGDGVKHGDLDETMYFPQESTDVHMGRDGLRCADCHRAEHHAIRGRLMPPDADASTRVSCEDCHAAAPHREERLNAHTDTVACQTCHIPRFAVETGTKMWWDWSLAGRRDRPPEQIAEDLAREVAAGGPAAARAPPGIRALFGRVGTDADVHAHYDPKKGLFLVARRQAPEYRWYDGTTERYIPGQRFDGAGPLPMNRPRGSARDPRSKIWPFKVHRGVQPIDAQGRHLLVPHVFGQGGYWSDYDWEKALRTGAQASGIPFSGKYDWVQTEMFWPQNHMVQPKDGALRCADCHGDGGRMDWRALGYPGDPARQGDRRQMGIVRDGGGR